MTRTSQFIYGINRLAKAIEAGFKIICTRQKLEHWRKMEPPFPVAETGNRYDREECFEWVRDMMRAGKIGGGGDLKQQQLALSARERTMIRKDARDELRWKRETGEVIDRAKAELTCKTAVRMHHALVRAELERNLPERRREKLLALGIAPEIAAAFAVWDAELAVETITKLEKRLEEEAK